MLKEKDVKATFFLIGVEAEKNPSLTKRIYAEGHEIGNHTFTHPDISNVSKRYFEVELNLTERFFEGKLGVKPVLFRPPYSIDQEPDTADQVRPLELAQQLGYITVGDKVDPNDWRDNPRRPANEIVADVLKNLPPCDPGNLTCGNIILLHDGGRQSQRNREGASRNHRRNACRRATRSCRFPALLGKTRADVMPPISANERWASWIDELNFSLFSLHLVIHHLCVLRGRRADERPARCSSARLASFRPLPPPEFHRRSQLSAQCRGADSGLQRRKSHRAHRPIGARSPTIQTCARSSSTTARKTGRLEVTRNAFQKEIADGRVTVLTKPNSGKAAALNYALEHVTEELFVGIDADTIIAPDAISRLVPHFRDSACGGHGRQRQGRQPREPLDALAGAGIHHQPELRTSRARTL